MTKDEILALKVSGNDAGEDLTIKQYLCALLTTLWKEREGFSGKRPFGNSSWEFDLYCPLIQAGVIYGKIDSDGYLESVDSKAGWFVIDGLIRYLFNEGEIKHGIV